MKRPFIEFLESDYSQREWFWVRVLTGIAGMLAMLIPLIRFDDAPFPEGICLLLPCQLIGIGAVKAVVMALAVFSPIWYIVKPSGYSLALVSAVSVLALTIQKSNGIHHRDELVSMIFIVQGIAFLVSKKNNAKGTEATFQRAIRYSVQILAAGYVASALTKLNVAGIYWVIDSPNISLQMIKTYCDHALSSGDLSHVLIGEQKAAWVLEHQNFLRVMFFGALMTELFAFLAAFRRKLAFFCGIALLAMHILIDLFTSVMLMVFVIMLVIYMLRLPGIIIWQLDRFKQRNGKIA